MSGQRTGRADSGIAPLLKKYYHQNYSFSSYPPTLEMTPPPPPSLPPRRSVFLGVDVGTGSARAGLSSFSFSSDFDTLCE